MSIRSATVAASAAILSIFALVGTSLAPGGAARAQPAGTPTLTCITGERYLAVMHGTDDMFSTATPDLPPTPGPGVLSQYPALSTAAGVAGNIFDSTHVNYLFGDTLSFTLAPGEAVVTARVSTRIRSNGDISSNDTLSFGQWGPTPAPTFTPFTYNGANIAGAKTYAFNTLGAVTAPNGGANPVNILAALTANQHLDVVMQDDSSIDFLKLEMCIKPPPPPPYDIEIKKSQDGDLYRLQVNNLGRAITGPAKIEVTEVVPAGLNVNAIAFGGPGWSCTPTAPVTGPDAIVCTYMLASGTITNGASLPAITLRTTGRPMCPNCARARLYFQYLIYPNTGRLPTESRGEIGPINPLPLPGSWVLVTEPNMTNNLSCVPNRSPPPPM